MTTMVILKTMMIYIHKNSQFPEPLTYHRFGSTLKFLLKTLTEWNSFSTSSFQWALFSPLPFVCQICCLYEFGLLKVPDLLPNCLMVKCNKTNTPLQLPLLVSK